ncbi:MAG: family 10 glycosylhydrolase [Betaproteobacteria bacterium]|nr:family 10 glycosylhydrolase [Betaproteobacteria bacterium]
MKSLPIKLAWALCASALALSGCAAMKAADEPVPLTGLADARGAGKAEVRGTWITTTANAALSTPESTAHTMRTLRAIGLNTVYVECWKNGYTNFPSETLKRVIGVDRRPADAKADPSDGAGRPARDLLEESVIEAHRNGLVAVAWFEYGFMAAHQSTLNHLRRQKPDWLSRDIRGGEVAPNGFVWMNPLHPEARRFLLELVLEAIDRYDLDGIQLDDRIVWPYVTMGYDDHTKKVYAAEHGGREPPADHTDPAWMRWRADKVNEFARLFTQEVRARRPGLIVSLSPAVYPWSWEHYLLEWPKWAAWTEKDRHPGASGATARATPRWDEFIPQAYRLNYTSFETTWLSQVRAMRELGGDRQQDLLAGIRIQGDGPDSTWDDLRRSIELTRAQGNGGHVLWFSRGVLERYPRELTAFYGGWVPSPRFAAHWRPMSLPLFRSAGRAVGAGEVAWERGDIPRGRYQLIGHDGRAWTVVRDVEIERDTGAGGKTVFFLPAGYAQVELLVDRRDQLARGR